MTWFGSRRTVWPLLLVAAAHMTGCGLFSDDDDDDPFDVAIKQDVPVEFTLDSAALCPPGEDCSVPSEPSPGPVELPDIEIPVEIDVIELTMNDSLADASGRLKKAEIEAIEYEIDPNSLNIPSLPMQLYIAPISATSREAQSSAFIGEIPSAAPMTTATGTVEVDPAAQDLTSENLKSLKFKVIGFANKDIEQGEQFPAQGEAKYNLTFKLKFSANPADQF